VSDDEQVPAPDPNEPARDQVDLARSALAGARAEARRRGQQAAQRKGARAEAAVTRSTAAPDGRDPQPLGAAMEQLSTDRGWQTNIAIGGVMSRWSEIVGADVAAHCTPDSYSEGVLTLRTDSTAWAAQVRILAPDLVRRLNEELGHGSVVRVDVRGPGSGSWAGRRRLVKGRGPRDTFG